MSSANLSCDCCREKNCQKNAHGESKAATIPKDLDFDV